MTPFPIGATLAVEQLAADPYPVFARLRAHEPVTWAPALNQWLVTSRDIAMEVLRDHERFRTDSAHSPIRDTFGAQMLSTEGEDQRRYKSACAPPFNARAAEGSRPLVESIVGAALARVGAGASADLRADFAAPIALGVIARVIGLPASLDDHLRAWYDTFVDALMNYERDPSTQTRAHAAVRAFRAAIAPRLASPDAGEQTLLASLARAHPRLLDDEEIGSNALIVLFGGIETTEGLIANALWAMFTHPAVLARARASDADLDLALEESLRWEPAVQTCTRYAADDVTLHGAAIPAGATVQCMIGAMNRDPAHYAAPDRFDPWRTESLGHAAFGFGRHFCLGAALAKVEARVAIRRLFEAFPALRYDAQGSVGPHGHEFRKAGRVHVALR
ncbi:MAG TPA: cytochrome P450 [Gemmatimonadaceae bacterium]|nr:cytochrome P450 [Gemmatimonadaceae bacterium]